MPTPTSIQSVEELESLLAHPNDWVVESMKQLEGDLLILGVGGKMGPTLARMASQALADAGNKAVLHAASSFSEPGLRECLEGAGIQTHRVNLLDPGAVESLPEAANVIYMVGRKFGSTGAEWQTWATNVYLAGRVAERFAGSRIVAFSSGNIYPFVPVESGGATEDTLPGPVGEYAMSCLGRERMFDYFSNERGARVLHYRLNYAAETRYGVLLDIATRVWNDEPVDVSNGYVNVVWQGYANAVALRALELASSPPAILNVTGPETLAIRELAMRFGDWMRRDVRFTGAESSTALLSNAAKCHGLYGLPEYDAETLAHWVAEWVMAGGQTLDKPTHFETRDGKF